MQTPLQVVFQDLNHSEEIEEVVRRHAAELERYFDRITACRVVVQATHPHHDNGRVYHVRIDLSVPHKEILVTHDHDRKGTHQDVYAAIGDSFKAASRQLETYVRKLHGDGRHEDATV